MYNRSLVLHKGQLPKKAYDFVLSVRITGSEGNMATEPGVSPVVCGHRGAPALAPENTLESFELAFARGATWVEFDVRPAGGGIFVVHHDPVTADGKHVASTDRSALPAAIPTFEAVVDCCEGYGLDVELKTDDVAMSTADYVSLVVAELDAHCGSRSGDLLVTSFDAQALGLLRAARPEIPTGLLFHDKPAEWAVATAVEVGHRAIAPWVPLVDLALMERARAAGLEVATWTVNEPAEVQRVADLGVNMIIGDDPAVIVDALQSSASD